VNPSKVVLPFPYVTDPHHPTLVVLDIALQAAISALHLAHPSLDHDHEPPPYDFNANTDVVLAQILVVSSIALLDLLRHYRAVQDQQADF
jgi:hypothetical protein